MVSSLLVKGSDVVKVGQQVAVVEVGAAPAAAPAAAEAAPPPPPPKAAEAPKPAAPEPPKPAPKPAPKVREHHGWRRYARCIRAFGTLSTLVPVPVPEGT